MSNQNERTTHEPDDIPRQQKDVSVKDYPYDVELADALKDIEYLANKNTILNSVKSIGNMDKNMTELLEKLEDKQYSNSAEVVSATGLVETQYVDLSTTAITRSF
jgi:hypothetical protein